MPDKVLCDGIVLTAALREIYNAPGDVVGLLFGRIQRKTINLINDMQDEHTKDETTAVLDYIAVTCDDWHDGRGNIDTARLAAIVDRQAPQRLIGWFSSRMNTQFRISMRECSIHRQLHHWLLSVPQPDEDRAALVFALMGGCQSDQGHVITQDFRAFAVAFDLVTDPATDIARALIAVPTEFRNLGASTQCEFAAFVPCSSEAQLSDLAGLPPAIEHPLEAYVAAAVTELEASAVVTSELQQQVSLSEAEVASLVSQISEQQLLLRQLDEVDLPFEARTRNVKDQVCWGDENACGSGDLHALGPHGASAFAQ